MSNKNDLTHKGNDPGAVKHGNFMNYYTFHPAQDRIKNIPDYIWTLPNPPENNLLTFLDIGCNTGELTTALHKSVTDNFMVKNKRETVELKTLGIDIDPVLIERAKENNKEFPNDINFICCDIMQESGIEKLNRDKFNIVSAMSITMWIHLIHGDNGLKTFLHKCADLTDDWLIIEPQEWKSYRNAQRRLIKNGDSGFEYYSKITRNNCLFNYIDEYLTNECNLKKVYETLSSKWNRKLFIYRKNEITFR